MKFYRVKYQNTDNDEINYYYCLGFRRLGKEVVSILNTGKTYGYEFVPDYELLDVQVLIKTFSTFKKCLFGHREFNIERKWK